MSSNLTLHRIIYVSSATEHFSEIELEDILTKSRKNNLARNITGVLIYSEGNILQVLEGDGDALKALYDRITIDHRHFGCIKLQEVEVDSRNFSNWSMGFKSIAKNEVSKLDHFWALTLGQNALAGLKIDPTLQTIIETFIKGNR